MPKRTNNSGKVAREWERRLKQRQHINGGDREWDRTRKREVDI